MSAERLLVGSCGGLAGTYLARRLSLDGSVEVWGSDVDAGCVGGLFVSRLVRLPPASSPSFIPELCALLRECEISYYVPTHSAEVRAVSQHASEIRDQAPGTRFLVCPWETFVALEGKAAMARSLTAAGIPVPRLYGPLDVGRVPYPAFAKDDRGSGGSNGRVVTSAAMHAAILADDPDVVFCELVRGDEYTVDCMFDEGGALLGHLARRRVKCVGGAVVVTETAPEVDLSHWVGAFARQWRFAGCVNFQCVLTPDGPRFIDVNLRYASGGLPLAVESGLDVPALLLRLLRGERILPGEVRVDRCRRVMRRYFEESFEVLS